MAQIKIERFKDEDVLEEYVNEVNALSRKYDWQIDTSECYELFDGTALRIDIDAGGFITDEYNVYDDGIEGKFHLDFKMGGKYYRLEKIVTFNGHFITLYEWDNEEYIGDTRKCNVYDHERRYCKDLTEVTRWKHLPNGERQYELLYSVWENVW